MPRRRVFVLSEESWQAVLEAAAPLPKNAKLKRARRALAACLRDYRGLRISRDALRDRQASWRRIDKLAADFHDALIAELLDKRVIRIAEWSHKQKRLRIAEWSHKRVSNSLQHWRETIKAVVETLGTLMRARKGKLDPERDWLYLSLLGIWTNHFGGKLRTSTTASGGPCLRFVRTAMALVLPADEVPSTATIRAIIKAVHRGKGIGMFRPRGRGGSSLKK